MSSEKVAPLFHELMINLGYEKYIAQGGDWGATISKWIAELYPENCIGLHLNLVPAFPPSNGNITDDLSEEEIKGLENFGKISKDWFRVLPNSNDQTSITWLCLK